jgi:hypothetical protein
MGVKNMETNSLRKFLFTEDSNSQESIASLTLASMLDNITYAINGDIFNTLCNYAHSIVSEDDDVANTSIWEVRVWEEFNRLIHEYTSNAMQSKRGYVCVKS